MLQNMTVNKKMLVRFFKKPQTIDANSTYRLRNFDYIYGLQLAI